MSVENESGLLPSDLQAAVLGGDLESLQRARTKFGLAKVRSVFMSAQMTIDGGFTPLHMACMRTGDTEPMVRHLLELGVSTSGQTGSGVTALAFACRQLQLGTVSALLDAGADINAADKNGYTPLMYAVTRGQQESHELAARREELIRLLVERGAKIDQKDIRGRQAVHHAAQNNDESCFLLIRDMGADIYAPDDNGKLPLDLGVTSWARALRARLMSESVMGAMGDGEEGDAHEAKSSGFTL